MIRVNLARKKRATGLTSSNKSSLFSKINAGQALEGNSGRLLKTYLLPIGVVALAYFLGQQRLEAYKANEIQLLQTQLDRKKTELTRVKSELAGLSNVSKIREGLEKLERSLQTKITTIKNLVETRLATTKVLFTLSEITPKEIWLNKFDMKKEVVNFDGSTLGLQYVSDYIKALDSTIYFKEVTLLSGEQSKEKGVSRAGFKLEAKRR